MANVTIMSFGATAADRIGPTTRSPAATAYERDTAEYEQHVHIVPLQATTGRWVGWVSLACVAVFIAAVAAILWLTN